MTSVLRMAWLLFGLGLAALPAAAAGPEFRLPSEVHIYPDGRLSIHELFASYLRLRDRGWQLDVIANSHPPGTAYALPIIALRSPRAGAAVWILSGIHGEEPAGPDAIAAAVDELAALGERHAVVLLPLCNPQGYTRNWRYLNMPVYSDQVEGQSVGDSSHLLPAAADPRQPRAVGASSPEADAITGYVLRLSASYPPRYSIDLHEDNLISEGYVYSQGELGAADPLAIEAVRVLQDSGIPVKAEGQTRFGEDIVGGIIGPVTDSSIDELMSMTEIVDDDRLRPGPAASTVLVFETPARNVSLDRRIAAQLTLITRLAALITASP
jgi:hypothetical protein